MSALFGNNQEANLKTCEQMVEAVLTARGLDARGHRIATKTGLAWGMKQGPAEVFVFLTAGGDGDNFIQVLAPVMAVSETELEKPRLLRRLLELNAAELTGASFALRGQDVVVMTDRSTLGLDPVEVEEMIRRVAEYAAHYDEPLTAEFGGTRHGAA